MEQKAGEEVSFIAGGVGITPLLAQAQDLDLKRLQFYWTLRGEDIAFADDTFALIPGLAESTKLFITGKVNETSDAWKKIAISGAVIEKRRMEKDDVGNDAADQWYMCAGPSLKRSVLAWMGGKTVTYEDFNY